VARSSDLSAARLGASGSGLTESSDLLPLGDDLLRCWVDVVGQNSTEGPLPPDTSGVTTEYFLQSTRVLALVRREVSHNGSNEVRLIVSVGRSWPTELTLIASIISLGQTVIVMAVPARGARQLVLMFALAPSMARVRVNPEIAALAVE